MPNRISVLSRVLRSPKRILAMVLAVVFTMEVGVMLVLPWILPRGFDSGLVALLDALLLTFVCAPALWWVIIGPLRQIAIQEHDRSRTIVANAGEGILTFNEVGKIISCNRAATKLFRISSPELMGKSIQTIIPELPLAIETSPTELSTKARRSDGTQVPVQVSISALPSADGGILIAIVRDLTESQRAVEDRLLSARQQEAMRAQQMTTLAQLATGVAHEIRNPLTSIKMLVQVNRDMFAKNGLPTDDIILVEEEIRRMERSVTSLLEYARPEKSEFAVFSLQEAIQNAIRLIEGKCLSHDVTTDVRLPDQAVRVLGDRSQIQQLLLNLGLNAIDAMPHGGTLRIILTQDPFHSRITVTDTGEGMCDEVLDKLFSPFVTTKPNGVGLGLGICRRIADTHGGTLTGVNVQEGGAQFELRLPQTSQATQDTSFPPNAKKSSGNKGTE